MNDNTKKHIIVFDFDGTLTKRDSLLAFISFVKGPVALFLGLFLYSPLLVLMKLHLVDNGKTKQRLFSFFFKGTPLETFNAWCDDFGYERRDILRERGRRCLLAGLLKGDAIYVVSASIDNWVIPFFYDDNAAYDGDDEKLVYIVGTRIEVKDGKLTGRFTTPNCYGAEKVRRLQELVPDLRENRSHYYIIAFGDSRGDKEMLDYADEKHYKPFRK